MLCATRDELDAAASLPEKLSRRVLDWLHVQWLDDDRLTIEDLKKKKHLLYLSPDDNAFRDCQARLMLMNIQGVSSGREPGLG